MDYEINPPGMANLGQEVRRNMQREQPRLDEFQRQHARLPTEVIVGPLDDFLETTPFTLDDSQLRNLAQLISDGGGWNMGDEVIGL